MTDKVEGEPATSKDRAEKFAAWHGGRWDPGDEWRLAEEFDEVRRLALEEAADSVESALTSGLLTPGNVKQAARAIRSLMEPKETP